MTFPRILAALAAAFLGLVPVGAGAQTISGGGGVPAPYTQPCATVSVSTVCWGVTATWATTGTYVAPLQVNVTDSGPANAASSLLDLQIGGASQLKVRKDGNITFGGNTTTSLAGPGVGNWAGTLGFFGTSGALIATGSNTNFNLGSAIVFSWNSDVGISRTAVGTLAVGNGSAADGTGTFMAKYLQVGVTTVASLKTCNAGAEGSEIVVTDATATTFHSTVAGAGANHVKVVCLNSAWTIGG